MLQVLNERLVAAGLVQDNASTGLFQDEAGQGGVINFRGIEGQGDGGGQVSQIGVGVLQGTQRVELPGCDG